MDFEFNLDEVDVGSSNSEFTFDQLGGGKDELPAEDKLPGEELDEPDPNEEEQLKPNAKEAPVEKIEVQLLGSDGENDESNQELSQVESSIKPVTKAEIPDINFEELITDAQTENVEPIVGVKTMEADDEEGAAAPVVVEHVEDHSESDVKTLDSYLDKLKRDLNLEENINSVEVEGLEDILSNNKMTTPEYSTYLRSLKKYFSSMNSKKGSSIEFSVAKDGSLVKKDAESGEEVIIKAPQYINVKNELIVNRKRINVLLFSLDKMRRDMIGGDYDVYSKLSNKYDEEMVKLRDLFKLTNELENILSAIQNTEKINRTNENIADMKISQVNNFSNVKELLKNKAPLDERLDAIISYINLNDKIIKSYKKTRLYNDVPDDSYIVTRELPPKEIKKTGSVPEEAPDEEPKPDISFWNPESSKYKAPRTPPPPLSFSPKSAESREVEEDITPKKKASKGFYSRITKGNTLTPEEPREEDPDGLNLEELNLSDDLADLEPNFDEDESEGYEIEGYQFNDKSKMTAAKQKEMEQAKQMDKAVPIPGLDSDSGEEGDPEDREALSRKDVNRIARQLNKPVPEDENIKVIHLDHDLTLKPTKCDDSKTKRSGIKTTNRNKDGKVRKRKGVDPELKNCIFPYKFKKDFHNECFDDGDGPICATERKENCALDKYAYCEKPEK